MKISVVIPAHNEKTNLEKMTSLLFKHFKKDILEIIVVDDCSNDGTGELLDKLAKKNSKIIPIHRHKNGGVGNAIKEGLKKISQESEYTLLLDCDFLENTKDIKRILKYATTADGILGSRYINGERLINYPLIKKIANRSFHFLSKIFLKITNIDVTNNFKLYKTQIIRDIIPLLESEAFSINAETGLFPILLGYNLKEIPVSWIGRTQEMGNSNFKVLKAGPGYVKVLLRAIKYKYGGFPVKKIPLEVKERIHFDNLVKQTGETYYGNLRPISILRFKRKSENVLKLLEKFKNPKVLELGCGTGLLTKNLLKDNKLITIEGIDISPEAIKVAKKDLIKYKNVIFRVGSATNLPYRSGSFDAVIGNSILHHLPLGGTLKEIKRVLKPGGVIWFCEPNLLNPQIFLEKKIPFIKSFFQDSEDEKAFLRWGLSKEIKRFGFKEITIEPYEFLHPLIPSFFISTALFLERIILIKEFAGTILIVARKRNDVLL